MVKTRVSTRFKTAVGGKSHNRSEDLEQLAEKYNVFNKNLKCFIAILKQHSAAMEALTKSRIEAREEKYQIFPTLSRRLMLRFSNSVCF